MIDLKLDSNQDLATVGGDVQIVQDVDEVIQALKILLMTRQGEFFGDVEMGLDTEYVLGKEYNQQYAAASITDALLADPRVISVEDVDLVEDTPRHVSAVVKLIITLDDQDSEETMEVALDAQ